MAELFGMESVIAPLTDEDITNQWVVIKPEYIEEYKEQFQTKDNQVVKATSGFGCKGAALSIGGGKVYHVCSHGFHDVIYRNDILGIANAKTLIEMGIEIPVIE